MTTVDERRGVRDRGIGGRVRHLAEQANPALAAGAILVPLLLTGLAVAVGSSRLLLYTHIAAGAVWFGVALFLPTVLGPVLGGLDGDASQQFTLRFTPKMTFVLFGTSLATVVSGTLLLAGADYGLGYGFDGLWPSLALGLGWGLWVFGLVVPNRLHLKSYYESWTGDPDPEVLETVEKRTAAVGLFEAVGMLAVILVMVGLRLGGLGL